MSSNENPDQELEQVLQTYFESEAERLKAPAGLWARIEAGMHGDTGRGAVPPVWQRLVQRGRWGLSPALVAVALLAIAVSIAWLAAAGSGRDDAGLEIALSPGGSSSAAFPTPTPALTARRNRFASAASATAAPPRPAATSVPSVSAGPAGSEGAAGPAGAAGSPGAGGASAPLGFNFLSDSSAAIVTGNDGFPGLQAWVTLAQPPLPSTARVPAGNWRRPRGK